MRQATELVEVDSRRLEQVLGRVEQSGLDAQDAALIRAIFESYVHVVDLVEDRNTTIRRLRRLLFGARTESTEAVVGSKADEPSAPEVPPADSRTDQSESPGDAITETTAAAVRRGHGRHGAEAYRAATRIAVPHPTLTAGDPCPDCSGGIVYDKAPGVLVRITGQPPLAARVYQLQKLRCHLCGRVFTAEAPPDAGERKYDARAASMIALLKYGTGLPFNRVDGLQGDLGVPLPASTQWEIVRALAQNLTPVFDALVRQAAQGHILHNDDTTVRILQLRAQADEPPSEADAVDPAASRRGLYTSGVVSVGDGHRVALFFSGRRHAGENLAEVLRHRADSLPPPIQMCDALARNLPGELRTIVAHCLAHARRQFVEIHDRFPEPCRHLLESLVVVYRVDAEARTRGLSPESRLRLHQEQSGPTLHQLHGWLTDQLERKHVEPNSALGGAIRYLLRHWDRLTLFLRVAGAPLDNNVCERVLKRAILHRKNALFYRTAAGARVGDQLMSLIVTCGLNQANPFEYLTELQHHTDELESDPDRWLPWNYREALA